jgi:hypothetical protein
LTVSVAASAVLTNAIDAQRDRELFKKLVTDLPFG